MQLYDAKIRLANGVMNEVLKRGLTAPEVICLQRIHGSDAIVDIRPRRMGKHKHDEERARLEQRYGAGIVQELFGANHAAAKLPTKLNRYDDEPKAEAEPVADA